MEKKTGRSITVYWPKMSRKIVKEGYNQAAATYLKNRDKFKSDRYLQELVGKLEKGDKVLDVGCGAGRPVAKYLADQGFKVKGVDFAEEQIKQAREQVPEGEFEVKDMVEMEKGEYQVEAVVSFYSLFHVERERHGQILKIFNSFLPVGGWLLTTLGTSEWEGEEEFMGVRMWWSHWGAEKNRELIKEAGFKIEKEWLDRSAGEKHLVVLARKN